MNMPSPLSPQRLQDAISRFGLPAEISTLAQASENTLDWQIGQAGRKNWPVKILISSMSAQQASSNPDQHIFAQALIVAGAEVVLDASAQIRIQQDIWQVQDRLVLSKAGEKVIYQLSLIKLSVLT